MSRETIIPQNRAATPKPAINPVMERPARLLPVPVAFMALGAGMLGRKGLVNKICGDLQVDISKTRELLGWNPPLTVAQGLQKAVEGNR